MSQAVATGSGEGRRPLWGRTPAEVVRHSGLPQVLADAVLAVTGKTKLWGREQTDVARELCGHFLDGLETGASPAELLRTFGDPRTTARLITRAKKRGRPLAWRTMVRTAQAVALLTALAIGWYGWAALRFYTGSPTIRFNILAEINAPSQSVPKAERGWPLYRDAARELYDAKFRETIGQIETWPVVTPGTPQWTAACTAVDSVRPSLEKIRRATRMERSAYVISSNLDSAVEDGVPAGEVADPTDNPPGIGVLLPQLLIYRSHARLLAFEVRRAAHEGRPADAEEDVRSLLRLAQHASEDGTLIAQFVGLAIAHMTFDTLNAVVRDRPGFFTDEQLQRLAHTVASYTPRAGRGSTNQWVPDLSLERRSFADLLQRFYTDDGKGDGRLCVGMNSYYSVFSAAEPAGVKMAAPVLASVVANRQETQDVYNRLLNRVEAEAAKPRYLRDFPTVYDGIEQETSGVRNSLVGLMLPPISRAAQTYDITRTLRDATAAGLAIELFKRQKGAYPVSWEDMVPSMLPAAPIDPWSGRALVLKAGAGGAGGTPTAGRPLVYSYGANRKDDGGSITTPWDVVSAWSTATIPTLDGPTETGDWVIWPKPEPKGERPQVGPVPPIQSNKPKRFQWSWVGSLTGGGV